MITNKDICKFISSLDTIKEPGTYYLVLPEQFKKCKSKVKEFLKIYEESGIKVKIIYQYTNKNSEQNCEANLAV